MPRVIITVPENSAQPYRFSLDRKTVKIGRGSDNDIVIDTSSVSSQHAEMRRIEGGYELGDMGSTNGIKLRGVRHDKIALESGMSLRLGEVTFDFTLTAEELDTLALEKPLALPPLPAKPPLPALPSAETQAEEMPEPILETNPKPKSRQRSSPKQSPKSSQKSSGTGVGMILLFIVLAAAAFVAGLSIRHQKETGETLIKAIVNKGDQVEKETPPVEPPTK